jgi:hypothetical protein
MSRGFGGWNVLFKDVMECVWDLFNEIEIYSHGTWDICEHGVDLNQGGVASERCKAWMSKRKCESVDE